MSKSFSALNALPSVHLRHFRSAYATLSAARLGLPWQKSFLAASKPMKISTKTREKMGKAGSRAPKLLPRRFESFITKAQLPSSLSRTRTSPTVSKR